MADARDESDFVDAEFQTGRGAGFAAPVVASATRPPNREELETRVLDTQQRLEELRRAQSQLEQERAALEEARRRRTEYHTGREEILQHLTRGVGLLEEAEFGARQEAQQMGRTLEDLRDHLGKVQALNDEVWTQEAYAIELTRALTAIENARMEWNAARLKWPLLSGTSVRAEPSSSPPATATGGLSTLGFWSLCRLGVALTWPVALAVLLAAAGLAVAWYARF